MKPCELFLSEVLITKIKCRISLCKKQTKEEEKIIEAPQAHRTREIQQKIKNTASFYSCREYLTRKHWSNWHPHIMWMCSASLIHFWLYKSFINFSSFFATIQWLAIVLFILPFHLSIAINTTNRLFQNVHRKPYRFTAWGNCEHFLLLELWQ